MLVPWAMPPACIGQDRSATAANPPATGSGADNDLRAALNIPGSLQSRFRFEHLTSADGLSGDSVFSILQDHRGFMWFGTQGGLNRYDGYRVTQYHHDPRDPNSLGDDFVLGLFEDSKGGIWSGRLIISRFDPDTETFTRYSFPSEVWPSISAIVEDSRGFVWVPCTGGQLYRFDLATKTLRVFDLAPNSDRAGTTVARSDAAGILWLGTGHGLLRFDPATGSSIRYPRGSPSSKGSGDTIVGMEFDKSGKLWLLTADGALSVFDPITRTFVGGWAVRAPISNGAYSFGVDPSGIVWLGGGDGLKLFDPSDGTFRALRNDPADGSSLSGNEVWSIARDREGNMWFGVKGGGVNRLSVRGTRFGAWRHDPADPDSLGDSNVRAIAGDTTGTIWLGTYTRGLDRFEPKSGKFVHYRHDPRDPRSLDSDAVYFIYTDRLGTLWTAGNSSIDRLDRKSGTFKHFLRDGLQHEAPRVRGPIYYLHEDRAGRFWFGGSLPPALLDKNTGATTLMRQARRGLHVRGQERKFVVELWSEFWFEFKPGEDGTRREASHRRDIAIIRRAWAGARSSQFLFRGFRGNFVAGHRNGPGAPGSQN